MTTQPEALHLAEVFETYAVDHQPDGWPAIRQETLNSAAAELRRLHAENEALRVALTFYANGEHYNTDPDEYFDTVSGEGLNWLFSGIDESTTSIENGSVAKHALESTAPQPAQHEETWTAREIELIDAMIENYQSHANQCDGIANRRMAEKQKCWDMERVALLRKVREMADPNHPTTEKQNDTRTQRT